MLRSIRHILHIVKCKLLYDNKLIPALYKLLCKLHLVKPYLVIYVDGGICSQMHQYLLGRYYAEKGMHVAYDLGWYARNGMDNNGIFERKFEFTEMWPDLPFEAASNEMVTFYHRVFSVNRNGMRLPLQVEPPKYLGGYYFFDSEKDYAKIFSRYFSVLGCHLPGGLNTIDKWEGVKCGIHVRRGDLASMKDYFYGQVTKSYYSNALEYVKRHYENAKFFFFSDELDWVEQNLVEEMDGYPFELIRGNKAWEDLALMAHCDCFISSQGSAGKVAALMNGKGLLIIPNDPHDLAWKERYVNTLVIDN